MFVVQQKTLRLFFEKDVRIRNVQAVWKFPAFCAKRDLKKSVRIKGYPKLPKRVFLEISELVDLQTKNFRYFWRNHKQTLTEFVLPTFHENSKALVKSSGVPGTTFPETTLSSVYM